MNIRKDSGPLKWILIGISVLFLFVMLILPLSYVMYTAFSKGIKVFLAAVTDKYALHSIKLTIEVSLIAVVCNTFFGIFASWLITKFQFKGTGSFPTFLMIHNLDSPDFLNRRTFAMVNRSSLSFASFASLNCFCW